MVDAIHLERMSRELKCPICLSLLNSAVSLTCNHLFCNSCIIKSMKLLSCCPVCKVPYQRREIRPAPHMDNLVNVYKSMEASCGVNISMTPNPSVNLSDEKLLEANAGNQTEPCSNSFDGDIRRRRKRSRLSAANLSSLPPSTSKVSFPAKKRIQLPKKSLSETLLHNEYLDRDVGKAVNEANDNSSNDANGNYMTKEKRGTVLSPFFWLRESNDVEKLSQQTHQDVVEMPLMDFSSFSDVKDSEDQVHNPSNENVLDTSLASDVFNWTQKSCSPELCTSPIKTKAERKHKVLYETSPDMSIFFQENGAEMSQDLELLSKSSHSIDTSKGRRDGKFTRCKKANKEILSDQTEKCGTDKQSKNCTQLYSEGRVQTHLEETHLPIDCEEALPKSCNAPTKFRCAFCQSTNYSEVAGEMVHYLKGRPVPASYSSEWHVIIHAHRSCAEWAPNVFFEGEDVVNLEAELCRSRQIKCSLCGIKGAALGCYEKSCRKSYHFPCVKLVPQCRWDTDNFVMLCPFHASSKLPNEIPQSQRKGEICEKKGKLKASHTQHMFKDYFRFRKLVICFSGVGHTEKKVASEFERKCGVTLLKKWNSSVTHVIASTDETGACRRTLKVLKGILEGKWILSLDWVEACMKENRPVPEDRYEISTDIHGVKDGPRLGRLRLLNNKPKLFNNGSFYFTGKFEPTYKSYLQDLVVGSGGIVLHRKPVSHDPSVKSSSSSFVVYNDGELEDARGLASSSGSKLVSSKWVIDSIAGYKLA